MSKIQALKEGLQLFFRCELNTQKDVVEYVKSKLVRSPLDS